MTVRKQRFLLARTAVGYLSAMKNSGYVKIETDGEDFVFELPLGVFERLGRQIRSAEPPPREERPPGRDPA